MTEILLLGAFTSILTQGFKYLVLKVGKEAAKNLALVAAFIIAAIIAYIQVNELISPALVEKAVTIFGIAIGFYEVIIKRILAPMFDALNETDQNYPNI